MPKTLRRQRRTLSTQQITYETRIICVHEVQNQGRSITDTAAFMKCSEATVSRWVKRHRETGGLERVALKKFSDMIGQPMAAHVAQTLELLFEYASSRDAPPGFLEALNHHKHRLEKNHNMKFWKEVMWFRPSWIVQCARPSNTPPISWERANNLFPGSLYRPENSNEPPIFCITEEEWKEYMYVAYEDYRWDPLARQRI